MALRKASAYSKKKVRPYTRVSNKRAKAYIKTVPPKRIIKFNMGNAKDHYEKKHPYRVKMVSEEKVQIRDNAIEACRLLINKSMNRVSQGNFYLAVKIFPHHILRENKIAAGAGADRLSSGMRHSFGVTTGRAAIVKPGKELFEFTCIDEKTAKLARDALKKIKPKVPCKTKIIFEKIKNKN